MMSIFTIYDVDNLRAYIYVHAYNTAWHQIEIYFKIPVFIDAIIK